MTTFTLETLIHNKASFKQVLNSASIMKRVYGYDLEDLINIDTKVTFDTREYVWEDGEKEEDKVIIFTNEKEELRVIFNLGTEEIL